MFSKRLKLIRSLQFRNLLQEVITVEVDIETYRTREQGLEKVLSDYRKQLQGLPKKELQLARLIREREVNDNIYSMFLKKTRRIAYCRS